MKKQGRIKYIQQPFDVSASFKKGEIVIETEEQYPQVIKFEFHQDNVKHIEGKQIGQRVEITFDIRGKEYNHPEKGIQIYNTLVAYNVSMLP